MGRHLNPWYGQVILVSGYPALTAVNWSQHWCAIYVCHISLPVLPNWLESVRIKHWFPCGADGRAGGWCTVTWLPIFLGWVDLLTHGAPQARFARQSSANKQLTFGEFCYLPATLCPFPEKVASQNSTQRKDNKVGNKTGCKKGRQKENRMRGKNIENSFLHPPKKTVMLKRRPCRLQTADCAVCTQCRLCRLSVIFFYLYLNFLVKFLL